MEKVFDILNIICGLSILSLPIIGMIGYINLSLGIKLFIVLSILDFIFGYLSDYKNEKNNPSDGHLKW